MKRTNAVSSVDRTYAVYITMLNSCNNPDMFNYRYYGERLITVCKRWESSFENFLADMGHMPSGHVLFRVNKKKGYTPDNVIWLSAEEYKERFFTGLTLVLGYKGVFMKASQWSVLLGLHEKSIIQGTMRNSCSFAQFIKRRSMKDVLDELVARPEIKYWKKEMWLGARIFSFTQTVN